MRKLPLFMRDTNICIYIQRNKYPAENLTLVTNNMGEFDRVPLLNVENWL